MSYSRLRDVKVTTDLLETAERTSSRSCAVALAIKDQNPRLGRIEVNRQWISFTDKARGRRYHCITPQPVYDYILNWDAGLPIDPFSFRLRVVRVTEPKHNTQIARSSAAGKKKPQKRTKVVTHASRKIVITDRGPARVPTDYRPRERAAKVFIATAMKVLAAQGKKGSRAA